MTEHLGNPPTLAEMTALRTADFRSWLARRAGRNFKKTSTARALSVVRGFFRWLERSGSAVNHAVRVVRSPKLPHSIPKPLSAEDSMEVVQTVGDSATASWIGQRDVALFTLLYGCRSEEPTSE